MSDFIESPKWCVLTNEINYDKAIQYLREKVSESERAESAGEKPKYKPQATDAYQFANEQWAKDFANDFVRKNMRGGHSPTVFVFEMTNGVAIRGKVTMMESCTREELNKNPQPPMPQLPQARVDA